MLSGSPVRPAALGLGAFKSPTGDDVGSAEDFPSAFEERTDAEVGKWTFHERLVHYMDGKKILHSNHKAVEFAILFEAWTYVPNLNPMRRVEQTDILLLKYQKLIEAIEDEHFVCKTVCAGMLKGYNEAKKQLTGNNLWQRMEKEMTRVKTFASKIPGINCLSELPSGTTQLCHMKKRCISKLWKA